MTGVGRRAENPARIVIRGPGLPVLVGALCGFAWVAGLRVWMVQLMGPASTVTWAGTFAGVLLPGALVGALLGWAEHLRRTGGRRGWRWLALSPLLFPAAVLSLPGGIKTLITTGEGGAAIGLVLLAMLAGASIAGRGRLWWRIPAFLLGFAIVPAYCLGGPMRPELDPSTPLGAWSVTAFSAFFVTLALACAIPLRRPESDADGPTTRHGVPLVLLGGLLGLTWAAGLRGFMMEIVDDASEATWAGTFGWPLLPGLLIGLLLGWAEHIRRTGGRHGWRWLALSPLLFAAIPFGHGPLEDGIGGGALGVSLYAMAGGYALSGRGPRWGRVSCGMLALTVIPVWPLTVEAFAGPELAVTTARGLWVALLFYSFLAVSMLAAAVPHRPVVASPATSASSPGTRADAR